MCKFLLLLFFRLDHDDVEVLDTVGEFLGEEGEVALAVQLFARSIELSPDSGYHKYLYLAQMSEGEDSKGMWLKGIDMLRKAALSASSDHEKKIIRNKFCNACASVCELHMTDLCDLSDAQETVEEYIKLGLAEDENNFDLNSILAVYKKVIGQHDEARDAALKAVDILNKLLEAADAEGLDAPVENLFVPPPESRANLARTLIDLEEVEPAMDVLEGVLSVDEENIAAWYTLACANLVAQKKTALVNCLREARNLCLKYPDMKETYAKPLEELFEKLEQLPDDSKEVEDNTNDWESEDEQ